MYRLPLGNACIAVPYAPFKLDLDRLIYIDSAFAKAKHRQLIQN
jgi:hypothetical protein